MPDSSPQHTPPEGLKWRGGLTVKGATVAHRETVLRGDQAGLETLRAVLDAAIAGGSWVEIKGDHGVVRVECVKDWTPDA